MDFTTAAHALKHLLELTNVAINDVRFDRYHCYIFKDEPTKNGSSNIVHFTPTEKFLIKVRLLLPFLPHLSSNGHGGGAFCISDFLHNQPKGSTKMLMSITIDRSSKVDIKKQIIVKMHVAFLEFDKVLRDIEEPFI
ncbi:hypothetical protein H7Y21_03755 [Arenimonas sp.]|nr:hypothetical protein [Candidatus Parcubacteria bacterium]